MVPVPWMTGSAARLELWKTRRAREMGTVQRKAWLVRPNLNRIALMMAQAGREG